MAQKLGITNYHEIVDYTHAKQNLFEIVAKLPKNLPAEEAGRIVAKWKNLLWEGKLGDLKQQINEQIQSPKKRKQALRKFANYFSKNHSRMQYASFRSLNLPIGSGCVESAIRRVINLRLKSPGIFWKIETAEVMLFLRSQVLSGRWNLMLRNIFNMTRPQLECH